VLKTWSIIPCRKWYQKRLRVSREGMEVIGGKGRQGLPDGRYKESKQAWRGWIKGVKRGKTHWVETVNTKL
jgi:hypothetical protein